MEMDRERNQAPTEEVNEYKKSSCSCIHCSPNARELHMYNNNGQTRFSGSNQHMSFMKYPTSTDTRLVIPLQGKRGETVAEGEINQMPSVFESKGVTASEWQKWMKRYNTELGEKIPAMSKCMSNCLFLSIIGWPYCCYRIVTDGNIEKQKKKGFLDAFNAEVMVPRGLFVKFCASTYSVPSSDANVTFHVNWLAIALTQRDAAVMKSEGYDFNFSTKRNRHEETADGHCIKCGNGESCNLYCY
jgi:hypothetical protein